jgi:hypothetical protein
MALFAVFRRSLIFTERGASYSGAGSVAFFLAH